MIIFPKMHLNFSQKQKTDSKPYSLDLHPINVPATGHT